MISRCVKLCGVPNFAQHRYSNGCIGFQLTNKSSTTNQLHVYYLDYISFWRTRVSTVRLSELIGLSSVFTSQPTQYTSRLYGRRFSSSTATQLPSQICPWIGFIHGLDWIGLGPTTVMYKILTAYVFQQNRPLHCCFFYFSLLTNIDCEQSSTMSWLDLAINMQH